MKHTRLGSSGQQLVQAGKVLYVGSSNFAGWQIADAQWQARDRRFMGLVSEQSKYSLQARTIELEVIPAMRHFGLGLIPYSPLGGGLLGGALEQAQEGRRSDPAMRQRIEAHRPQLEAYEALCRELGASPADVALAWLHAQPAVTATITGPRTVEQIERSLPSLDLVLSQEVLARLDTVWPGLGGEAPEAYAW